MDLHFFLLQTCMGPPEMNTFSPHNAHTVAWKSNVCWHVTSGIYSNCDICVDLWCWYFFPWPLSNFVPIPTMPVYAFCCTAQGPWTGQAAWWSAHFLGIRAVPLPPPLCPQSLGFLFCIPFSAVHSWIALSSGRTVPPSCIKVFSDMLVKLQLNVQLSK